MALAKKCDRCGKFYEHYPIGDQPGVFNAVGRMRRVRDSSRETALNIMNLCHDCMRSFDRFMKGTEFTKE